MTVKNLALEKLRKAETAFETDPMDVLRAAEARIAEDTADGAKITGIIIGYQYDTEEGSDCKIATGYSYGGPAFTSRLAAYGMLENMKMRIWDENDI